MHSCPCSRAAANYRHAISGLNHFPHDKYVAIAMLGWAVGKAAALRSGPEATKTYAQLNSVVLGLWLVTNLVTGAPLSTSIIPSLLLGAYLFAGLVNE